jgi:TRAP-type C4-dicarboxylate transport system permease small subunit
MSSTGGSILRSKKQKNLFEKFDASLNRVLVVIGGGVLAVMMFLTAADVGFRYIFNSPIAGALETVEYIMAILIPFSIAYCAFQKSHVAVELIVGKLPKKIRTLLEMLITAVTLVFVAIIAWQNVFYTREIYESRLTSSVLLIPTYPFVVPVAVGFGAFALSLIVHFFHLTSEETSK